MAPPGWPQRKREGYIEIEQRSDGTWGWKKVNTLGRVVAVSGDGYQKRGAAVQCAKREHPGIPIRDEPTGDENGFTGRR